MTQVKQEHMAEGEPDQIVHAENQSHKLDDEAAIPGIEDIPCMKNKESMMFDETEDSTEVQYIQLLECPCKSECKGSDSFTKAAVWSFHGHITMLSYLMQHLVYSIKHQKTEEDAFILILDAIDKKRLKTICKPYTPKQRRIYREAELKKQREREAYEAYEEAVEEAAEEIYQEIEAPPPPHKQARLDRKGKKGKGKKGKDDRLAISPYDLQRMIEMTTKKIVREQLREGSGSSAGSADFDFEDGIPGCATIPIAKLRVLQQTLQNAEHCMSQAFLNCLTQSKKLEQDTKVLVGAIRMLSQYTGEAPSTLTSFSSGTLQLRDI